MDLRKKALWGFGCVILITMAILACLSFFVIAGNYLTLESTYVRSDVNLIIKNIDSEITTLKTNSPDWGAWDDTYAFTQGREPDYVAKNLVNTTFRTLRANFIIITDRDGRILYGQAYDLVSETPVPLRPDILAELGNGRILALTLNGTTGVSGFLDLQEGPVILSSYPVLHSDYTGPANGMLIIGRNVDNTEIRRITENTPTDLSILPFDQAMARPSGSALFTGPGEEDILVLPLDEKTVEGKKIIPDVYGNNALLLTVRLPRDIYQQGKETIFYFILLQLGIVFSLGTFGIILLDRTVLARMSALSGDIAAITDKHDRSARVRADGDDELSRLAGSMNRLLDQVEKTQSDLAENEQKFREIFNNVNDGIELHEVRSNGLPGKYLEMNDVICRMLQYSREELLTRSPLDFNTGYYNRSAGDIGEEITTLGRSRFETEYRRKDGTVIPVEVNSHVVVLHGTRMVLTVVRDITERRIADRALKEVLKKLHTLSNITRHDILNQLTALRGYLGLSRPLVTDPDPGEYIRKAEVAALAIQDQISFSRDYQDIGIQQPRWQDVRTTILRVTKPLATDEVRVSVEFSDLEIYTDPLLEKVFYNLVENAIRHGGNLTTVTFSLRESDTDLLIICEDNGTGIPPAEKKNIFERKYFSNTGLGLFLAKEILGMTGISIRETGEPGKGARFEISVPKNAFRFRGQL